MKSMIYRHEPISFLLGLIAMYVVVYLAFGGAALYGFAIAFLIALVLWLVVDLERSAASRRRERSAEDRRGM